MRSAIIEKGIVVNIILGEIEDSIPCSDEVCIGWTHDNDAFIPPPLKEPEPQPLGLLSARQFRLGLHVNGLLASVQGSIDALNEPERTAAQIEWEYATQIERDHPLVENLSAQLGLTDQQIDAMWRGAMTL